MIAPPPRFANALAAAMPSRVGGRHIEIDQLLEIIRRRTDERLRHRHAGIVDQDADMRIAGDQLLDAFELGAVGQVGDFDGDVDAVQLPTAGRRDFRAAGSRARRGRGCARASRNGRHRPRRCRWKRR